jgi:hypothetical protein
VPVSQVKDDRSQVLDLEVVIDGGIHLPGFAREEQRSR